MRHFTESVNTRFEPGIVRLLDKCLENDWCKQRGMNRSDLVRHLVRIGIKNFHQNQPKNRDFTQDGQTYIESNQRDWTVQRTWEKETS